MTKKMDKINDKYAEKFGDVIPFRSFSSEKDATRAALEAIKSGNKIKELDPLIYVS